MKSLFVYMYLVVTLVRHTTIRTSLIILQASSYNYHITCVHAIRESCFCWRCAIQVHMVACYITVAMYLATYIATTLNPLQRCTLCLLMYLTFILIQLHCIAATSHQKTSTLEHVYTSHLITKIYTIDTSHVMASNYKCLGIIA